MPRRSSPEHAEQKSGEERCVHKPKGQLEHVHDVIEFGGEVGGADTDEDPKDGCPTTHRQVMLIRFIGGEITLVNIVSPDRVKSGNIPSHAGHKGSHQRRKSEAEDASGE